MVVKLVLLDQVDQAAELVPVMELVLLDPEHPDKEMLVEVVLQVEQILFVPLVVVVELVELVEIHQVELVGPAVLELLRFQLGVRQLLLGKIQGELVIMPVDRVVLQLLQAQLHKRLAV
jgi:hypothetical protein